MAACILFSGRFLSAGIALLLPLAAGQVVIREGEVGEKFYIIKEVSDWGQPGCSTLVPACTETCHLG
jgi:hypothetical protein